MIGVYSLYIGLSQELYVEEKVESDLQDIEEEHRLKEVIVSVQEELESGTRDQPGIIADQKMLSQGYSTLAFIRIHRFCNTLKNRG